MFLSLGQTTQRIFHDDDRAIDDKSEVERAQAHQITRYAKGVHAGCRHQHGDRDHCSRDQRRADIAEQQKQYDDDQKRAFDQILFDGGNGGVDQLGPVVDRLGKNIWRQRFVDIDQFVGDAGSHDPAVFADQHQDGGNDRFGTHATARPGAHGAADHDVAYIAHPHRNTCPGGHDRVLNILDRLQPRVGADEETFPGAAHIVGASRHIRPLQGVCQFGNRQTIGGKRVQLGLDQILFHITAVGIDAGNAQNIAHLRANDPILHRAQIGGLGQFGRQPLALGRQIAAVRLPAWFSIYGLYAFAVGMAEGDRVEKDLAKAGAERREVGLDAVGQAVLGLGQALCDLLTGKIDVGAVGEYSRDLAEAVPREGPRHFKAGNAGQCRFDGESDLFLDVDRPQRGHECTDLHLSIGDVWHGIDRQLSDLPSAKGHDQ